MSIFSYRNNRIAVLLIVLFALFLIFFNYTQLNLVSMEFTTGNGNVVTATRPMAVLFGDSITQQGFITENHGYVYTIDYNSHIIEFSI